MIELSKVLSNRVSWRVRRPQQREAGRGGTGDITLGDQGLRKESPFPTQINCVCLNGRNWKRGSQQKTSEGFSKARYGRSRRQSAFTRDHKVQRPGAQRELFSSDPQGSPTRASLEGNNTVLLPRNSQDHAPCSQKQVQDGGGKKTSHRLIVAC